MKSDSQIAKEYDAKPIEEILSMLNIKEEDVYQYGKHIAKVSAKNSNIKGKLILVTSTSPDKAGIGKTTTTIGLSDAINKHKRSIACVREPSLGPVFGAKGGACGGGYSQCFPLDEINLEFTGDFYTVTSINNLICAAIDNEIFHGNKLNIDKDNVLFRRVIDMNDRALRHIDLYENQEEFKRYENFKLTPASEIMAILCLAKDLDDFLDNIQNISVARTKEKNLIYVRDLNILGSIAALSKKVINPNMVQSLKANPIFIHGGPFANIAHGTNSLIATKSALSLSDYVVTEAGFGSDMGCEKFINLVSQTNNLDIEGIVLVTTISSLKDYSKDQKLEEGVVNLQKHINHLKQYNIDFVVTLNKYSTDKEDEIKIISDICLKNNVNFSVNTYFLDESLNKDDKLVKDVLALEKKGDINYIYRLDDNLDQKVSNVVQKVYQADGYKLDSSIVSKFESIKNNKEYALYPICFAKNPNSFSGNLDDKFVENGYTVTITDIEVMTGAKYILIYLNKVLTLPGLGKNANLYKIKYDKKTREIIGLS